MIPIALSVAHHLHASPYPFAMIVALSASAAFMTPISSPVNMLVLVPGQYRFSDFVKVGVPFTPACNADQYFVSSLAVSIALKGRGGPRRSK